MGLLDLIKEAYSDVAPIIAEGSQLLHYKIPGDADIKVLQAEKSELTKETYALRSLAAGLLKSSDPSLKAQQADIRAQVNEIIAGASDADRMLSAAISGIQQIQAKTRQGQDASIDDVSQIASLRDNANSLYHQAIGNISQASQTIHSFFSSYAQPSSIASVARGVMNTVIGTAQDATRTGATAMSTVGHSIESAAGSVPTAIARTATLTEWLPYLVGGAILIGGIMYIAALPKPRSGFSFGD